jgi:hypothetical protein
MRGLQMKWPFVVLVTFAIVVPAIPQDRASTLLSTTTSLGGNAVSITLGTPQQIFHLDSTDAMGMSDVPDMHIAPLQLPDKSYLVFVSGGVGHPKAGATGLLSTSDFLTYKNAGQGTSTDVKPVLSPSCPGNPGDSTCWQEYDADYAGANFVWKAKNGDLLMLYEGECRTFGASPPNIGSPGYDVIALARSTDGGMSWVRKGVVITGTDPKSSSQPLSGQPGVPESGSIVANGFIYTFFPYISNDNGGVSHIQVARSPVDSDGAAGTWTKYHNGSWSQPGILGLASDIVTTGPGTGCTRPVQTWVCFNTYLNAYVLLWLANEGWFFSTSTDLVNWTSPTNFMPMQMWQECQPMDLNYIFVTPGNAQGVIGRTGYALYAHTPRHGQACPTKVAHILWMRPFTFNSVASSVQEIDPMSSAGYMLEQSYPNPFNPSTIIRYGVPQRSKVSLTVFNTLGQQVAQLVDGEQEAGHHEVRFDASGLSSGVYFYRIQAGNFVSTKKLLLLR